MRERRLAELETAVLEDGGVRGFLCRKGPLVEALFVDPPYQGMGYGKQLLDHLKDRTSVAHLWVFAQNSRAIKFYHREEFWAVKLGEHRETGETNVHLRWEANK